jgi:anti-sigma28 factor (negative regulator of flagellin synthesis)
VLPEVLRQRQGYLVQTPDASLPVRESENIREELVARIRAEIAQGSYDTEEKLEIAFQRMLEDVE